MSWMLLGLMLISFVGGVMNLAFMGLATFLMIIENCTIWSFFNNATRINFDFIWLKFIYFLI